MSIGTENGDKRKGWHASQHREMPLHQYGLQFEGHACMNCKAIGGDLVPMTVATKQRYNIEVKRSRGRFHHGHVVYMMVCMFLRSTGRETAGAGHPLSPEGSKALDVTCRGPTTT